MKWREAWLSALESPNRFRAAVAIRTVAAEPKETGSAKTAEIKGLEAEGLRTGAIPPLQGRRRFGSGNPPQTTDYAKQLYRE